MEVTFLNRTKLEERINNKLRMSKNKLKVLIMKFANDSSAQRNFNQILAKIRANLNKIM